MAADDSTQDDKQDALSRARDLLSQLGDVLDELESGQEPEAPEQPNTAPAAPASSVKVSLPWRGKAKSPRAAARK